MATAEPPPRLCLLVDVPERVAALVAGAGWRITREPAAVADAMLVAGDDPAAARALSPVPMLLLPPRGWSADRRARALGEGADDVLPGDWTPAELLARLDALTRRGGGARPLRCGDLAIDPLGRSATRSGRPIRLLPREYALLRRLAVADGRPVSRETLLGEVWALPFEPGTNVVEVHVSRLRAKLDRGFAAPLLHTVKGEGYMLAALPAGS